MSDPTEVLLIDDDEDEFVLIDSYLAASDQGEFHLSWVRTFEDGLKALRRGGHDVYLLDYRLGAESGLRLLEQIREDGLHRPVIMLTGAGVGDLDQAAMRAGAFDYLDKSAYSEAALRRSIRYSAERGRIESQLQLQAEILANVHDAVFLVDDSGVIRSWNAGAEQIFGLPASRAIDATASQICPGITRSLSGRNRGEADKQTEFSTWCARACGEKIALAVRLRFLPAGRVIVCANDITPEVRLEQQLSEAAEAEQRRIGQDIHDDLCQQLAGAGCFLKAIGKRLAECECAQGEALDSLGSLISEANARARDIARGLFPSLLQMEGLQMALEELVDRTSRTFGVACTVHGAHWPALAETTSVHLYRIAQEAVSNAARHSGAARIEVRLGMEGDHLLFVIRDDGQGIASDARSSGMGLVTMKHRARILGGELEIRTSPETGTEIRVTIPCAAKEPIATP
ncbi:MAG: response regulator [Verrucomicrobia bacterium]|nr:response regulator [Verrucomicrobiota bacterium]